jgi:hypothetical protein
LAAFCIFYADNISKNFAVSISMVLSSLASFLFFDFEATGSVSRILMLNAVPLTDPLQFLVGTSIVLIATYMYSKHEQAHSRPSPIQIHSYEMTAVDKSRPEQHDMSISIPKTPLIVEEALSTSRPGSPNSRLKRKGEQLGYFTKHHG